MKIDTYTTERAGFIERMAVLAGGTTYREPMGAHGTKLNAMTNANEIAAALAFARRGNDDIGPDVAYCWALRSDAYRNRVVSKLSIALRCHELRHANGYRTLGANAAWDTMIWDRRTVKPAGVTGNTWEDVVSAGVAVMLTSAWDALVRAERALRRE